MKAKVVAAKLVELAKKYISFNKSLGIYANGENNDYAERTERLINNSATAKPATKLFRKYIVGKGFGDTLNNYIVDKENNTTLRKLLFKIAHSYAYHNGVFIHVNYNMNYNITSLSVLPYKHCCIGKKDDKDWNGKILVYDNWLGENGKVDKNKINVIDVYNPNKSVIQSQIEKAGGIENYKGQVFFYNPEDTIYPSTHLDNVFDDVDSEYRTSIFKNISLRKGFFGKTIIVTPPMIDGELRKSSSKLSEQEREEKREAETQRDNFRKQIYGFLGVENIEGALHMEMDFEGDNIDKVIKFINIETNINDKLFAHTEKSVSDNILATLGIPSILLKSNDKSLFGNSGALLQKAKEFYQDNTEEDRENIQNEILIPLLSNFKDFQMPQEGLKILKLIKVKNETNNEK